MKKDKRLAGKEKISKIQRKGLTCIINLPRSWLIKCGITNFVRKKLVGNKIILEKL